MSMIIGSNIKYQRKMKNISQVELAKSLGVSQAMIAQYESGKRTPKIETIKKIADIFDRLKVLNLVDSIFELKTILDYYENLYNDFEKEKVSKKMFEEYARTIGVRCKKVLKIILGLTKKIEDIKYSYDLTDDEVKIIDEISLSGKSIKSEYESIIEDFRNKLFSYSKLNKNMELLNLKLSKTEDKLDYALKSLGSLKEDEARARDQLYAIKNIINSVSTA